LCTSDIERRLYVKTALAYFIASIICVAVANVYALFGHVVRSVSMDLMFLYPLIGGIVLFAFISSRVSYNLYNSGIATLTSAAMLDGIIEIAGTSSNKIRYIRVFGIILIIAAAVIKLIKLIKFSRKSHKRQGRFRNRE